jgi:hypothetical protein
VRHLENRIKSFLALSTAGIILIIAFAIIGFILNGITSILIFKIINMTLLFMTMIIFVVFFTTNVALYIVYKGGKIPLYLVGFYNIGMRYIMPIYIYLWEVLNSNKEEIMNFYIELNNSFVNNLDYKVLAKDILVVMPHCIQNANCTFKITHDYNNCKKCGKCDVGSIIDVIEKYKAKLVIVTGGTAARNEVKKNRPKLIIAVACERDLTSGIRDVIKIPVLGIKNKRPNGPCYNTCLDVNLLEQALKNYVKMD